MDMGKDRPRGFGDSGRRKGPLSRMRGEQRNKRTRVARIRGLRDCPGESLRPVAGGDDEPRPAMRPGKRVSPNPGHEVAWIRGWEAGAIRSLPPRHREDCCTRLRAQRTARRHSTKRFETLLSPLHPCFNDSLNPGCGDSRSPALMGYRAGKEPCSRVTGCRAL